jgi:hypothetical protein
MPSRSALKAASVSSTSASVCPAVGIMRNITTPGGTTGYMTPETKIPCFSRRVWIMPMAVAVSPAGTYPGVIGDTVSPMSYPRSVSPFCSRRAAAHMRSRSSGRRSISPRVACTAAT